MEISIKGDFSSLIIDGKEYMQKHSIISEEMCKYLGTKEYTGIVADIQRWYYGKLVRDAWCTTSISYFANLCGVSEQTGKHENVDMLKEYMNNRHALDCTKRYGGGSYKAKPGDIIFFSTKHLYKDCTHVGSVVDINHSTGWVKWVGGNTDNAISVKENNYLTDPYVIAFGRIDY